MATERQIVANKKNALQSTGPRSLAGKSRSRMNAVRHGLTAEVALLPGEDPAEFEALRRASFNSYYPQGALENQLVERAVSLIWRLRRIPAFEIALFEWTAYYQAELHDACPPMRIINDDSDAPRLPNDPDSIKPLDDLEDGLKLGRVVDAMLSTDVTARLTRYEMGLQKNLFSILKELRNLASVRTPLPRVPPKTNDRP